MKKVEIIPAINADNFEQVKLKLGLIQPHADWAHIDIADGTFTPNTLWHDSKDLLGFGTSLKLELHLMLSDIDTRIDDWVLPNVSRIVFHLEAAHDPQFVLSRIKSAGLEAGLGINIGTSWEKTRMFWDKADTILFLSVNPGKAGQIMDSGTVGKVSGLHNACSKCRIAVDGGVNKDNAKNLKEAGASILAAASAIFGTDNIKDSIDELKNV